jgi:hypothetical protein
MLSLKSFKESLQQIIDQGVFYEDNQEAQIEPDYTKIVDDEIHVSCRDGSKFIIRIRENMK